MITQETSRSGHKICRVDGRLLASSIDPIREARVWAANAASLLNERDTVFVVGLGCAYHLQALREFKPFLNLIVIERFEEVASLAREIHETPPWSRLVVENDWMKLTEHGAFRDGLGSAYKILQHPPSGMVSEEWARAVKSLLLGREKIGFLLQLRTRPELFALLDPQAIAKLENAPVSIKALQKLFSNSGSSPVDSQERRLWRVLEELVL